MPQSVPYILILRSFKAKSWRNLINKALSCYHDLASGCRVVTADAIKTKSRAKMGCLSKIIISRHRCIRGPVDKQEQNQVNGQQ